MIDAAQILIPAFSYPVKHVASLLAVPLDHAESLLGPESRGRDVLALITAGGLDATKIADATAADISAKFPPNA